MDPAHTTVLVGAGHFIHLYTALFYRAFYPVLIGLGSRLGYVVQKEKTKDLIFSFHDTAGFITLGHFTINTGTKLVNLQSNGNTFQKP